MLLDSESPGRIVKSFGISVAGMDVLGRRALSLCRRLELDGACILAFSGGLSRR
jgi:hypothetical protein